jgi:hypothetical protein
MVLVIEHIYAMHGLYIEAIVVYIIRFSMRQRNQRHVSEVQEKILSDIPLHTEAISGPRIMVRV